MTTKREPLIIRPEDHDRPLDVVGTKITVLASRAATGGCEVTLQEGREGTGPPPHSHAWDESFFVLDGQVELTVGGKTVMAEAGTLVHVPGGTVHGFRYGPGGGRMLEFTGQGSGAATLFAALDRDMAPGPPDIPKVIEVLERNGVTVAS